MGKLRCLCQYCGKEWEIPAFLRDKPKCPKCTETQSIKVKKQAERGNVFGYETEEKPKVTYEYFED